MLVLLPLVVGLLLSALVFFAGGRGDLRIGVSLPWLPLVLGLLLTLAAAPVLVAVAAGRRRAEQQRTELERAARESRRRLVARLDHEIKNPIQGIRAALADEPSQRQRDSIDAQARRLAGLLSDLRKIGEVEHAELELGPVDLTSLVEEAVTTVAETTDIARRRLTVALPTAPRPLPRVLGDEDLLFLAVVNVLTNAVKYSAQGDAVEVRGRAESDGVVLEIADTGRGIAPDEIPLVWEELGRSREARAIDGAGLGLPMVRAVLERHGGSATLESWHGEGSTVTLRIPVGGPATM